MKTKIINKVNHILKSAKLRRTEQRIAILKVLLASRRPLSQAQISKRIGSEAPDKVTIYRTLEAFIEAGIVHKTFLRKNAWHFELSHNCSEKQCHPHFVCIDCGDTRCLIDIKVPMVTAVHKGFIINRQQVHLEGLCPNCN